MSTQACSAGTVQVKYRGQLAAIAGTQIETYEAQNVEALLKSIGKRHGHKTEKAARSMLITLNGESILLLKLYKTILSEGDTISFFPICGGG